MNAKLLLTGMMTMTLSCLPAWAQDAHYPKWEVFTGASGASVGTGTSQTLMGGYQVSVTGHRWLTPIGGDSGLYRSLGLKFDFGTQHGHAAETAGGPVATIRVRQYLMGPQFTLGGQKAAASFHTLFGVSTLNRRSSAEANEETGLTLGVGGTFDVNFTKWMAFRLPQVEFIPTRYQDGWSTKNARMGIGVVFKLGKHTP